MIPKPYIAKWQEHAPWKEFAQVEQDLIISRVLLEIFNDEFLKENLAFRGGTALHKLYLKPASRYSEYEEIRMRLKLEINCKEHFNVLGWVNFPFEVNSEWFSGKTEIRTYNINELLGTKLRALYQRSKGRDLFDLNYARQNLELDYEKIILCFKEYTTFATGNRPPSKKEFLLNIEEKEKNPEFTGDLEALLRPEIYYKQSDALEWLKREIVNRIY